MSNPWQLVSDRPGGSIACLSARGHEVLALSAAAVHQSLDTGNTWSTLSAAQLSPPLYALARTSRSLFVGGANGLFRSRDAGRSWRQVLSGAAVTCLAVGADQVLIAGTECDGILRSDTDGDVWASGNPGLLDLNLLSLAVCEGATFAGTASGVYRSVNNGLSWREVGLPCGPAACECLASSGRSILAGTDVAGAFISTDAGRTWSSVNIPDSAVTAVALGTESRMAFGAPGVVYLSVDGGRTWRREAIPEVVLSLACVGQHILAGLTHDGVLRFDCGTSRWMPSSDGLNGRVMVDLVRTSSGALLMAGIGDGVQRSTDDGRTWRAVAGCADSVTRLAVDNDQVYAATSDGLYWSEDDGCSWSVIWADSAATAVATRDGLTVAALENEHLLVGHDGGWLSYAWDRNRGRIVSVGVSADRSLFVGCLAGQPVVWRSNDAGRSWSVWLRCPRGGSLSLATGEEVLAASDTRVYRLLGAALLPEPITCITLGAARGIVYAGTTRAVHISTDGGTHFAPWSDHLPNLPVLALHASPKEVYALLFGGSLWRRAS